MNAPGSRVRRAAGRLPGAGRAVRRAAAGAGTEVDYAAARDAGKSAAARGSYRVAEDGRDGPARPPQERPGGAPAPDPGVLLGERRRPGQGQRAEARQGRHRAGQAGAHRRDPVPPHRRAVAARVQAIAANAASGRTCAPPSPPTPAGKPVLAWHFDQDAIDAEAAADGWYALLTNLAPGQAGPSRSSAATRASTSSNAATASSKAPSPSPRCSWRPTAASPP